MEGTRVKQDTPLFARAGAELSDLLCRLFYDAESLFISPLVPGRSGAAVLKAHPFYAEGSGQEVVVKFGDWRQIDTEYQSFEAYVKHFICGRRSTTVQRLRRTPLLGGIVYSLLGSVIGGLQDFGSFYCDASIGKVRSILNNLFLDTCGNWYANPSRLGTFNLSTEYQELLGYTPENLQQSLNILKKTVQGKEMLQFKSLGNERTFLNPILTIVGNDFTRPTYTCITHGDLHQNNILVDNLEQTWLIDFSDTGRGHILRDIASLDSAIRLILLMPDEAALEERLQMEEKLCCISYFQEIEELEGAFSTDNSALAKAYSTVVHLRRLVKQLVVHNSTDDISEYYLVLCYFAMNMIRRLGLPHLQREHALLCASLLAERLYF